MFYDSAASGGAAGGIQAFDRDSNALTRLKIRSSNWEIDNNGRNHVSVVILTINETGIANGKGVIDSRSIGRI